MGSPGFISNRMVYLGRKVATLTANSTVTVGPWPTTCAGAKFIIFKIWGGSLDADPVSAQSRFSWDGITLPGAQTANAKGSNTDLDNAAGATNDPESGGIPIITGPLGIAGGTGVGWAWPFIGLAIATNVGATAANCNIDAWAVY